MGGGLVHELEKRSISGDWSQVRDSEEFTDIENDLDQD